MVNRIKEMIRKSGFTQKQVARELGVSPVSMSQIVASDMPRLSTLSKISGVIGVPLWSLVLSDDEIFDIKGFPNNLSSFQCPVCGSMLMVAKKA